MSNAQGIPDGTGVLTLGLVVQLFKESESLCEAARYYLNADAATIA